MYEMEITKDQLPAFIGIDPLRIDAIMQNKDNPTTQEIALIGRKLTIDPNNCTTNRTIEVIVEQSGINNTYQHNYTRIFCQNRAIIFWCNYLIKSHKQTSRTTNTL